MFLAGIFYFNIQEVENDILPLAKDLTTKKYINLTIICFLLLITLTGCDFGAFINGEGELTGEQKEVLEVVETYYEAILSNDSSLMEVFLHPEKEILVSSSLQDLGEEVSEENLDRAEYVSRYDFTREEMDNVNDIVKDSFDISIVNQGKEEAIFRAIINKVNNGEILINYRLHMELEKYDGSWYIHTIEKEN